MCLSGAAAGRWELGSRGHPCGHQGSLRGSRRVLCGPGTRALRSSCLPRACSFICFSPNSSGASALGSEVVGRVRSPAQGQMLGVAGILCTLQFHGPQWKLWVGKWLGRQAVLLRNVPLDSGIVEGPRNSYGDAWGVGAQTGAEGWAGGLVRPCPQNQPPPPVLPFSWGRRLTGCRGCAPKPRPFQGLPLQECGCWNYLASPHQTPAETALPSSVCAGPQRFGWEALSLSLSLCLAREIPPLSARAGGGGWGSGSLRLSRPHCTGAQEEKRLTLGDPAGFQQGWV